MPTGRNRPIWPLLGLATLSVGVGAAAWPARDLTRSPTPAGCRAILVATGSYRLTVNTDAPIPVVTFKGARPPVFEPISWAPSRGEAIRQCNKPMGEMTVRASPNTTPIIYQVTTDIWAQIKVDHPVPFGSAWPPAEFPYRDFGNMAAKIGQDQLWVAFRQLMADIATQLVARYADPGGFFSDAGAKWVAREAVKLMMQSYVEGKDPGLIIDGMLTRMVEHLKSHAESAAEKAGGPALKEAVRGQLEEIAKAVTAALVEQQPDGQTVEVSAYNPDDDCTHFFTIFWNFKGGGYRATLTVTCGPTPTDVISNVAVTTAVVEPGEAGSVTAQALSQLGVPMPLATATSTGIAAVQAAGAGEPAAVLAGPLATFDFRAAEPRADRAYDVAVNLLTDASTGRLAGLGRGTITVTNVAPEAGTITPGAVSAKPGDELDLGQATWVVIDRNADASNTGEVRASSLTLVHPADLRTQPLFDAPTNPRRLAFDGAHGRYEFGFTRRGRVERPHPHGTFPMTVAIADEATPVTTTVNLTVEDVAPDVATAITTPQFVHRKDGKQIMVTLRVTDPNGFDDITGITVDATAAGGGVTTLGNGLTILDKGPDWIDLQLSATFPQTDNLGQHWIPVTVTDEAHTHVDSTFLHVGNTAPIWGGHGFLYGADSVPDPSRPDQFLLTPPKGLCPSDSFRVGVIASDQENDMLVVTATILETGATWQLVRQTDKTWMIDMQAPPAPGTYTVELKIAEDPADKETTKRHVITVIPCETPKDDQQVGLAIPGNAPDIAAAPRDPTSQLMLGAMVGGVVGQAFGGAPTPAGGAPGPSAALLADSLTLLLGEIGGADAPPVETYVLATGGSTGPVAQMFTINRGPLPLQLAPQAVVLEPVAITPEIQARVTGLLQRYVAAGGQGQVLNAYCLEFLRKPPAAGTLMRIASADVAAPFARYSGILDAAERVRDGVGLHPDSDPAEYFHAIRQWSIWTVAEGFDAEGFADAFASTTRRTLEAAGEAWSDELEQAVRELAPNRWTDLQAVLREAGLETP